MKAVNSRCIYLIILIFGICPAVYPQYSPAFKLSSINRTILMSNRFLKNYNDNDETDYTLKNTNFNVKCNFKENGESAADPKVNLKLNEEEPENIFSVSLTGGYLKETEENYSTGSVYQSYKLKNVFSENFSLGLAVRVEYAKRQETGLEDINRWYDNSVLTANITFNPYNSLGMFGGVSISDTTVSSLGFSYRALLENYEFSVLNILTLSKDYFYYWNDVSQNFISDNVSLTYEKLNLSAEFFYGVVDLNYIEDYTALAKNPNTSFNIQLQYRILNEPVVNAGVLYNMRNYKYKSPLYYSPSHRNLTGAFANFYDIFGKIYFYFNGGMRVDNQDIFIWDIDAELGYDYNNFSVSIGAGRYDDPYYGNYNTFLNITKIF